MVLQRAGAVPLWGWAAPGEDITVSVAGQTTRATTGSEGKWRTILDLRNTPEGPYELIVQGKNRLVIADVLVGEVWLASGQSNMAYPLRADIDAKSAIARSAGCNIRQFLVEHNVASRPEEDVKGRWTVASPETTGDFSAVGYYFADALERALKTPVGIINSSWGGSSAEAWTSARAIDSVPELRATHKRQTEAFSTYPVKKAKFVEAFTAWVAAHGREDPGTPNAGAFAGARVSTKGWMPVSLPGTIEGPSLSPFGVLWLRQEVVVPAHSAGKRLRIDISFLDGYETIYWNGRRAARTTFATDPGKGSRRQIYIPAKEVKEGKNTLALRVYSPALPIRFGRAPAANNVKLKPDWLAKTEITFAPVAANAAPQPPKAPPRSNMAASRIFNAMIHPIVPYALRGVIWYQGEANASRAWQYRTTFPLLINDWRRQWERADLPFYFCQLPAYRNKTDDPGKAGSWAELREAQSLALALPRTGQAVLIDTGESGNIHPRNKKPAGERLARLALANDYGRAVPASGPVYRSLKAEGARLRLSFAHTDGGLTAHPLPAVYDVQTAASRTAPLVRNSPRSELEGFALCGADGRWAWADAKIDGDTVIVWSDQVPAPVAVRYAWADNPTCNLYNAAGLPAAPFRTDDFPSLTRGVCY